MFHSKIATGQNTPNASKVQSLENGLREREAQLRAHCETTIELLGPGVVAKDVDRAKLLRLSHYLIAEYEKAHLAAERLGGEVITPADFMH